MLILSKIVLGTIVSGVWLVMGIIGLVLLTPTSTFGNLLSKPVPRMLVLFFGPVSLLVAMGHAVYLIALDKDPI